MSLIDRVAFREPLTPKHDLPASPFAIKGEQGFAATIGRPTAGVTTDTQTFQITQAGESGPSTLQIRGRFQGGGGAAVATVSLWAFDQQESIWHELAVGAGANFTIQDVNSAVLANSYSIEAPYGATHLAFEIHAISAGTLRLMVYGI